MKDTSADLFNIRRPILLCGFTASGKSTIGRLLSTRLSLPFYDTDEMIVARTGKSIPAIFSEGGETLFRDLEHETAMEICGMEPSVISTGGGLMTFQRNAEPLAAVTDVVLLERDFDSCYAVVSRDPGRPLFVNSTREELYQRYAARNEIYRKYASCIIRNDGSPDATVDLILAALHL